MTSSLNGQAASQLKTEPLSEPGAPIGADPHYDLAQALALVLECIPPVSMAKNTPPEHREAARYLYERIQNYYGLMRTRKLTGSVEFLVPYFDGKRGCSDPGWYYKGKVALPGESKNWHGPYSSYKQACFARDKHLPRSQFALLESQLDAMA